ncbi:MAG TPA: permease [Chloroflexia bacterium]|nr:permease [Chloroflexia bacterium]
MIEQEPRPSLARPRRAPSPAEAPAGAIPLAPAPPAIQPAHSPATTRRAWITRGLAVILGGELFLTLLQRLGLEPAAWLRTFSVIFLSIFIEAAPFLLLGALVAGLIDAFIRPEQITRWVPRHPVLAVGVGTVAGFIFPVCECGVVPVVRQLYAKGLPRAVGITFLLAAPVMNPIVLVSTITAFGFGPLLVGRYLITASVAMTAGLLVSWSAGRAARRRGMAPAAPPAESPPAPVAAPPAPRPALRTRLDTALGVATDELFEMGRYLVVGCALAAALQTLVKQDLLLALGQGPIVSVLVMQGLAFILSVCSTVDAFLALTFVGTFSTGAVLTFLTCGPMVDLKSTLMFLGAFDRKTVAWLVAVPVVLTGAIGITLNLIHAF